MKNLILGLTAGILFGVSLVAATMNVGEKAILVTVSIDPKLVPEGAEEWPLYVYAARPNTRMPLSSFKAKFKDLPLTVTLSEQMFLLPDLTLKDAAEVVVVAKVSASKDPHQKSENDLIGFSQLIDLSKNPQVQLDLQINRKDKTD